MLQSEILDNVASANLAYIPSPDGVEVEVATVQFVSGGINILTMSMASSDAVQLPQSLVCSVFSRRPPPLSLSTFVEQHAWFERGVGYPQNILKPGYQPRIRFTWNIPYSHPCSPYTMLPIAQSPLSEEESPSEGLAWYGGAYSVEVEETELATETDSNDKITQTFPKCSPNPYVMPEEKMLGQCSGFVFTSQLPNWPKHSRRSIKLSEASGLKARRQEVRKFAQNCRDNYRKFGNSISDINKDYREQVEREKQEWQVDCDFDDSLGEDYGPHTFNLGCFMPAFQNMELKEPEMALSVYAPPLPAPDSSVIILGWDDPDTKQLVPVEKKFRPHSNHTVFMADEIFPNGIPDGTVITRIQLSSNACMFMITLPEVPSSILTHL
jgi:hypothetical protein